MPLLDDEGGNAVLRGGAVGDRHGDADIGVMRVGGESLGAVEHPAFAVEFGVGAGARGVGAGLGLGERPAADPFACGQLGEIALALLLAAHFVNVVGAERGVRGDDDAHRAIDARELFNDDGVLDVAQAGAAEFFGEYGAHVAEPAQFADHVEGERLRFVPFHDVGRNFAFGELPHRLSQCDLLRGVLKIHVSSGPSATRPRIANQPYGAT